ncbi:MAG: 1-(5-phosphoribosyl)-5-[(5-phosphoribosylamino)methylideneamino]imidazole-4-carboxamide isomerase [Promethearchaeota archaeon]|jgi:phosphoribosylformimino-5-aminoimidazole carboxamide ribotide isomerase
MEIIPAIDLSEGKCVRLYKGKKGSEKIYFEDPLKALSFWIDHGAKRLHIIDLDGAWGSDRNKELLLSMIENSKSKVKLQIGGGIRTLERIVDLYENGVDRVIFGTLAITNPEIIPILAEKIGSEHFIIAMDYKGGKIATHGWTKQTGENPLIYTQKVIKLGAKYILFSSIEADGTLSGPDFINIKRLKETVKEAQIYVAGGVRNIEDLQKLKAIGVKGVVIGRAFYEQRIPYSIITNSIYNE